LLQSKYSEAKKILLQELKKNKNHLWLNSNYAIVLYELRDYQKALKFSNKVVRNNNRDPLFLNYHAAILKANGKLNLAIQIWQSLLNRDVKQMAFVDCQEGVLWIKSLLNDIRFNLSCTYKDLNNYLMAKKYILQHLKYRKRGQFSLYKKREALKLYNEIKSTL
jgi:tetratricopeptide (TPR) repeat protein